MPQLNNNSTLLKIQLIVLSEFDFFSVDSSNLCNINKVIKPILLSTKIENIQIYKIELYSKTHPSKIKFD